MQCSEEQDFSRLRGVIHHSYPGQKHLKLTRPDHFHLLQPPFQNLLTGQHLIFVASIHCLGDLKSQIAANML